MNYCTTIEKEISGGKIILRPLKKNDLGRSLQWLTDPLVNKYLSQNFGDLTVEQEEKWFDYIQDSQQDMVFAILERKAGLHIGNCALHKINKKRGSCELGIVIGETAEVGADVTLYQGVTLGGTGKDKGKRHPTIEHNVTIGSGAKILGPITIGHNAKIGAGAVVVRCIPANSTAVGVPAHVVRREGIDETYIDLNHTDIPQ